MLSTGKPLSNTRVYVVDKKMQPVPIRVPGELLIAGEGLACGYTKDELTKARCVITHYLQTVTSYTFTASYYVLSVTYCASQRVAIH